MQQISLFIALLGCLYIYERVTTDMHLDGRTLLEKYNLNVKPFNCMFCISFWLGVALSLLVCNLFISLPLVYRVIQVKLLR